ncbi:tyrosine-type recombinase/integrase [Lachnoclostridium sp. MSJ-17]|uniref:tyrosine-type recombinase/integrase n=1 Tax=Lachnoclostridium sp. MSJ-17 TaxID=2841516 RepID=UPI001C1228FD|nr:site-specific integrase [Lachnoclostridium sp. MSJ-17]MBU5462776.1 site-specific integrase [Lachnoclostridium sp. MSJ-17]
MAITVTGSLQVKYNTWYAVINYKDENGKRKQKWIPTGYPVKGNKKRANEVLQAKIKEYNNKNVSFFTNITVAEYFKSWLVRIKEEVRPNTYRSYLGNMTNHIIPYFESKGIELQSLKPDDITTYYEYKHKNTELSGRTLKHHHQNISKALNDAIAKGYISFNPASYAKTIKEERFNAEFLNDNQIQELLSLLEGNPIKLAVELCSIYGFRRSEVLGLKWHNVDFENESIRICETLQQSTKAITGTTNFTADTKTESSNRTMPMTKRAREILQEQKERQKTNRKLLGNAYIENDYVCTFDNGKEITPNYLSKNFHKVIVNSDLPQVRLHDLRHSSATNLLSQGFSVVQVADWLGHSESTTTLRFYAHADKSSKMAIAEALNSV